MGATAAEIVLVFFKDGVKNNTIRILEIESLVNAIPSDLQPFIQLKRTLDSLTQEERITAQINEPTEVQYKEMIRKRQTTIATGLTPAEQVNIEQKSGLDLGTVEQVIQIGIDAGQSDEEIVGDLVEGLGINEKGAIRVIKRIRERYEPKVPVAEKIRQATDILKKITEKGKEEVKTALEPETLFEKVFGTPEEIKEVPGGETLNKIIFGK